MNDYDDYAEDLNLGDLDIGLGLVEVEPNLAKNERWEKKSSSVVRE